MATRALDIRAAIVTALLNIGVTPGTGWESGAGAPQVLAGRPKRDAIPETPERQLYVQHIRTESPREWLTAAGGGYRATFAIWLICPDPTGGADLGSKLERDVRRAIQLAALEGQSLANAGLYEDVFEVRDELAPAGVFVGTVSVIAEYLTAKGDP
jgi:hypothetical protein